MVTDLVEGVLNTTGEVAQVQVTFPRIINKTQTLIMDYKVQSSLDRTPQFLHVTYHVLPGAISNQSIIRLAPGSDVLQAGQDVHFVIDARDAYDNHLTGSGHTFQYIFFRASDDLQETNVTEDKVPFVVPNPQYK